MTVKPEISLALRKIMHGVYVISTRHEGRVNAMTAAWVARASFDPPLVTVSVGSTRFSHGMIKASGVFAINVLSLDEILIGKHFGLKSGKKTDKFANMSFDTKATGSPILKEAIAWLDCKVVNSVEAGDHTLFIGEVLDGGVLSDKPTLIYDKERFYK